METQHEPRLPASAWAEVDLDNLAHNYGLVRERVGTARTIMLVVKADAYGHGACTVARHMLSLGADALGVHRLQEGADLRQAGIAAPIYMLGPLSPWEAEAVVRLDLTPTLCSLAAVDALERQAHLAERIVPVQLQLEAGLGGAALLPAQAAAIAGAVRQSAHLNLAGIFAHLPAIYRGDFARARVELDRLQSTRKLLADLGIAVPLVHAGSSPAILDLPEAWLDMVRVGMLLYGLEVTPQLYGFKPVMQFKSRVMHLSDHMAGQTVGYAEDVLPRPTRIATLGVGYADGMFLQHLTAGEVLIRGRRAPVLTAFMDHTLVDVTMLPHVRVGDEAVIFGRQGSAEITATEVASRSGSPPYSGQCVTMLGSHVPRIYRMASMTDVPQPSLAGGGD